MESKLVLNQATRNIMVTNTPTGTSQLDIPKNGTLSIIGGATAYIVTTIEQHNLDSQAHPNLWYVYEQGVSSDTWRITHNLNRNPSVTVVDSANNVVVGFVTYIDNNTVEIHFNGAFKGKAYLN